MRTAIVPILLLSVLIALPAYSATHYTLTLSYLKQEGEVIERVESKKTIPFADFNIPSDPMHRLGSFYFTGHLAVEEMTDQANANFKICKMDGDECNLQATPHFTFYRGESRQFIIGSEKRQLLRLDLVPAESGENDAYWDF